jgi:hypothetical protein
MRLVYKDFNSSKKYIYIYIFYVVQSMTYVYKIKHKWLHYTLISLDELTIREAPIYRRVWVDKYGTIKSNYNQINQI